MRHRLLWLTVILSAIVFSAPLTAQPSSPPVDISGKNILVLYSFGANIPAYVDLSNGIAESVIAGGGSPSQIIYEPLDLLRFQTGDYKAEQLALLRKKYAQKKIELIISFHRPAVDFVLNEAKDIFPDVPIISLLLRGRDATAGITSPRVIRLAGDLDFPRLIDLAMRMFPDTRTILAVSGSAPIDKVTEDEIRFAVKARAEPLEFKTTIGMTMPQIFATGEQLPKNTIVVIGTVYKDSTGANFTPLQVAKEFANHCSAPLFVFAKSAMEKGRFVGGGLIDFLDDGRKAGQLAIDLLRGRQDPAHPEVPETNKAITVNWTEVQRLGGRLDNLPAGTQILNNPPPVWESHRKEFLIWMSSIAAMLFALSVGLLIQATRRRAAEHSLRESERKFRAIAECAPFAIVVSDVEQRTQYVNPKFTELFGYNIHELPEIDDWWRAAYPEPVLRQQVSSKWNAAVEIAMKEGGQIEPQEVRVHCKDGSRRDVEFRLASIGDLNVIIGTDFTERLANEVELEKYRHHLEEQIEERTRDLVEARDAAEAASRAKTTFLANMSHELRTPMHAIMGMTSLALRRASDLKQIEQLEKSKNAAMHLLAVINDILDISKIEAERMTLERAPFTLDAVVENMRNLLVRRAEDKGLRLIVDLSPELGSLALRGDALRIGQVLLNLVSNAIKFTVRGSIRVGWRVVSEAASEVQVRCEVADTGIGIQPDDIDRLFEAFEQGDGTMTRSYGGTGLGLAISKRLVQCMGGTIGADSTPGEGSCFWFALHITKMPTLKLADLEHDALTPGEQLTLDFAGTRILLAEDDLVNQEVTRSLLEEVGLSVDPAGDGEAALRLAQRTEYALILMDMQMPRLNGLDATRAIRAVPACRVTPIIALTANAFPIDRQACLEAGMNDHIGKPVDSDRLYENVLLWLKKARAEAANPPG